MAGHRVERRLKIEELEPRIAPVALTPGKASVLTDFDGTTVTLLLTGPGSGSYTLTPASYLDVISLTGTTLASALTLTTRGGGLPGTMMNSLKINKAPGASGALGRLSAPQVDLTSGGEITTSGVANSDISSIVLGKIVSNSKVTMSGAVKTFKAGDIYGNVSISFDGALGAFTAGYIDDNVSISFDGGLGAFTATFVGQNTLISSQRDISSFTVSDGNMVGSLISSGPIGIGAVRVLHGNWWGHEISARTGGIASVDVSGLMGAGSQITAATSIGRIKVGGDDWAYISAGLDIGSVSVGGAVSNAIVAGGPVGIGRILAGSMAADANITVSQAFAGVKSVTVTGDAAFAIGKGIFAKNGGVGPVKVTGNFQGTISAENGGSIGSVNIGGGIPVSSSIEADWAIGMVTIKGDAPDLSIHAGQNLVGVSARAMYAAKIVADGPKGIGTITALGGDLVYQNINATNPMAGIRSVKAAGSLISSRGGQISAGARGIAWIQARELSAIIGVGNGGSIGMITLGDLGVSGASIQADGAIGGLRAGGGASDLTMKAGGNMGNISVGNLLGTGSIEAGGPLGIGAVNVTNGALAGFIDIRATNAAGRVKSVSVNGPVWFMGAHGIFAGTGGVGSLRVVGNAIANLVTTGTLGKLDVVGSSSALRAVKGFFSVKSLPSVNAPFADLDGVTIRATESIGAMTVRNLKDSILSAGKIGSLTVGGDIGGTAMNKSLILAGYDIGPGLVFGDGDDGVFAGKTGSIGTIKVGGNLIATSIAAGVSCGANHKFGDVGGPFDDVAIASSLEGAIKSLTVSDSLVGSGNPGDTFGIEAKGKIGSVTVGGAKVAISQTIGNVRIQQNIP